MTAFLGNVGRAFLYAFGAAIVIYAPGVLSAPNLNQAYVLGVAALIASAVAGIKAIQQFVPAFTFGTLFSKWGLPAKWGGLIDNFARGFLGAFFVSMIGVLNAPDLSTAHSLVVAALTGAVAAGFRAIEGYFTKGEIPAPQHGI